MSGCTAPVSGSISLSGIRIQRVVPSEDELLSLPSAFYRCEYCNLKVKTKSNLRAHKIKTHKLVEDEKDFAFLTKRKVEVSYIYHCPVKGCKHSIGNNGFSKFSRLKQHYQIVHMQKSYQCKICSQLFSTPTAQAYHTKNCGTLYICTVCNRSYTQKKFLNQHLRRSGHQIDNIHSIISPAGPRIFSKQLRPSNPQTVPPTSTLQSHLEAGPPTSCQKLQPLVLPVLILPLSLAACEVSPNAGLTDNFAQTLTRLCSDSSLRLAAGHHNSRNVINIPPNGLTTLSNICPATLSASIQASAPTLTSLQQTSPATNYRLLTLIDVGTGTPHLTDACTQTDPFQEPLIPQWLTQAPISVMTETLEDDFSDLLKLVDCCTGTSPPNLVSIGNSPQNSDLPFLSNPDDYLESLNVAPVPMDLFQPDEPSNQTYPALLERRQRSAGVCHLHQTPCTALVDVSMTDLQAVGAFEYPPEHASIQTETVQAIDMGITPLYRRNDAGTLTNSFEAFAPLQPSLLLPETWQAQNTFPLHYSQQPQLAYSQSRHQPYYTLDSTDVNCLTFSSQPCYHSSDYRQCVVSSADGYIGVSCLSLDGGGSVHASHFCPGTGGLHSSAFPARSDLADVETAIDLSALDEVNSGNCFWLPESDFTSSNTQTAGGAEFNSWVSGLHMHPAYNLTPYACVACPHSSGYTVQKQVFQ